ncbi:MAG: SLC13 family permease, partial [Chloroflexota bacterium]
QIDLAFWIACSIFVLVLVLIATRKLHRTLSALLGASLLFGISYLGSPLRADLFIFNFTDALHYVDWNVIFLIMGMMIIIAIVGGTGIFRWLAFQAYRLARGRIWLLVIILMGVTSVASAFLDNVTTMLLLTPVTIQIAQAIDINPLALLMPELMASNVAGISTLIGTPTNVLIGSYAGLSFSDFLINLTPGVILTLVGLSIYSLVAYRNELKPLGGNVSQRLDDLKQRAQIAEPDQLKKAGVVGAGMLVLFVLGEQFQLVPAVTALMGATALLIWIRPDVEKMIEAVDWTTLVFFIALFIVVGSIQEVGLISLLGAQIAKLVGTNLILTMLTVIWASALFSAVIANIPFTAAMLPVIGYLSATVPGAESHVLFYCLAVGAALGGNGTLIGASANMVTAGIAEQAGYPITYAYFLKKGVPALVITLGLATVWLVLRFVLLP